MLLMNSLSIIVRYGRMFAERKMQNINLGFPEQVILMYISRFDHINQDTISQYFLLDKGAIAKTVSKLDEKGYIRREQNPDNKRENSISLTEKGFSVLQDMTKSLDEWDRMIFDGLSEEEIQQFQRTTETIAANVAKSFEKNGSDSIGKSK